MMMIAHDDGVSFPTRFLLLVNGAESLSRKTKGTGIPDTLMVPVTVHTAEAGNMAT